MHETGSGRGGKRKFIEENSLEDSNNFSEDMKLTKVSYLANQK